MNSTLQLYLSECQSKPGCQYRRLSGSTLRSVRPVTVRQSSLTLRGSADRIQMKTLLLLLLCIVVSSVGIATTEGAMNTLSQYVLMGTTVISAIVLLTGVTD